MTENEYIEMLKENALKIDETRLEKAHEIARRNYLCGKREALKVIEDIKADIEQDAKEWFKFGEDLRGQAVLDVLQIIDKHIGGAE